MPPSATYTPGTKLTVGSHKVRIIKYVSQGGFAHVYTATCDPPTADEVVCLKRVAVPNKALLNLLRAEVDAMQRLKGCPNIVQYIDSHAERNKDPSIGGYEVFVLMEYCEGGGLIDFMNTRLRDQLREHEVLKIMYDVTRGLAAMHYLHPPLIHRDLKIENVLLTANGDYKLCDFGSASPVLRAPKNAQELQVLDDDIKHHTTAQYRAPEMIDMYAGFPIDEKSDIWALGVFLYKLCYYTTPFEKEGIPAIMAASYIIPQKPPYSARLKNMIRVLLQPIPTQRPNVYQLMQEICDMRGVPNPLKQQTKQIPAAQVAYPVPQTLPLPKSSGTSPGVRPISPRAASPMPEQLLDPPRTRPVSIPSSSQLAPPSQTLSPPFNNGASPVSRSPSLSPALSAHDESFDQKFPPLSQSYDVDDVNSRFPPVEIPPPKPVLKDSAPAQGPGLERVTSRVQPVTHSQSIPIPKPAVGSISSKPLATKPIQRPTTPAASSQPTPSTPHQPSSVSKSAPQAQSVIPPKTIPKPASVPTVEPSKPKPAKSPSDSLTRAKEIQARARAQVEASRALREADTGEKNYPQRDKLKKILDGLDERSSTIVLENKGHIDSNLDFLRSLDKGGEEGTNERSVSSGSHKVHLRPSKSVHHVKSKSKNLWFGRPGNRRSHVQKSDSDSDEPGSLANRDLETPPATLSKDPFDDSSPDASPVPSLKSFRPTNSIQQRVHALVTGQLESPPRRTAKGYGKYTDDEASSTDGSSAVHYIHHSRSVPSLSEMPSHSPEAPSAPRKPSLKPKLTGAKNVPPKPKT